MDAAGLLTPCSSGLQLGSRYVADPEKDMIFDYLPESLMEKIRNPQDFGRVLVLDKWTGNADGRQAVFTKPAHARKYSAVLCCDLSYVMTEPSVRLGRGFQST
jgi:hypothetical protein